MKYTRIFLLVISMKVIFVLTSMSQQSEVRTFSLLNPSVFTSGTIATLEVSDATDFFINFNSQNGYFILGDISEGDTLKITQLHHYPKHHKYHISFKLPVSKTWIGTNIKLICMKVSLVDGIPTYEYVETKIDIWAPELLPKGNKVYQGGQSAIYANYEPIQTINFYITNGIYVNSISCGKGIKNAGFTIIPSKTSSNIDTLSVSFSTMEPIELKFKFYYESFRNKGHDSLEIDLSKSYAVIKSIEKIMFVSLTNNVFYHDDLQNGIGKKMNYVLPESTEDGYYKYYFIESNSGDTISKVRTDKDGVQISKSNYSDSCQLLNIERSGNYELQIRRFPITSSKFVYYYPVNILPVPVITSIEHNGSNANFIYLNRVNNDFYQIRVFADRIEKMSDINAFLKNGQGDELPLTFIRSSGPGEATYELSMENASIIDTGLYKLLLRRPYQGGFRDYTCHIVNIYIVEPILIHSASKDIKLKNPDYFPNKGLESVFYVNKNHILKASSPLIMKYELSDLDYLNYGTQYLDIDFKYIKNDGTIEVRSLRNYKISPGSASEIDLKIIFDDLEEGLRPYESISIASSHSIEMYTISPYSIRDQWTIHTGLKFLEKLGVTLSLPPYLGAIRNVKRKTITKDEDGNVVDVIYDGDKKLEYQNLFINAGIGFKYRPMTLKTGFYKPSDLAVGLYFMGMDLADEKSKDQLLTDETDYSFISRGSFNILVLGEYSIPSLNSVNTRIPIYLGFIIIPRPIDNGSNFAFSVGLGIDISLKGNN